MKRWIVRIVGAFALILVGVLGLRVFELSRGPALEPWHTVVPPELSAADLDRADWPAYLAAEQRAFDVVRRDVVDVVPQAERTVANRYYAGAANYAARFTPDWNRSFEMQPAGAPRGVVVLLHGLTDSPYSGRSLAALYRDHGFAVVAPRLPGHGTVPGGLTKATWEQWLAATRLAVREARRLVPAPAPLHIVGYSNGGALATKYTLDALGDQALPVPQQVVLLSPMIGVTRFARFAGVAGWPAVFPAFAKAAWLGIEPEFNPFKYNSFPVNAARESYALTAVLQDDIARAVRDERIARMPPVLTFQSVVDFTVSAPAVIQSLYNALPANGSELVLYGLNRNAAFTPFMRDRAYVPPETLMPAPPRRYTITMLGTGAEGDERVVARTVVAGTTDEVTADTGLRYPASVYSLSHIALPFPLDDPLYGLEPDRSVDYGVRLGTLAPRGERGVLVVSLDVLLRMASNPFFPDLAQRVAARIDHAPVGANPATQWGSAPATRVPALPASDDEANESP
ncbi:MAG: alpha/beta hydrolase [Proteobacteria bacterium]|nr:alpha/beta hydrolase [Pseudomonadota bacterium]